MTESKLQTIEDCGRCQFTIEETAMILEVTVKSLREQMNNPQSEAYRHYHKGRLQTIFEVRMSIIDMAKKGSTQAQEMFITLMKNLKMQES